MATEVLLFAQAREAAGVRRLQLEGATAAEVLEAAAVRFGEAFAAVLPTCTIVVDDEVVHRSRLAEHPAGQELAVLPPVSGGAVEVVPPPEVVAALSADPLDLPSLVDRVVRDDCGGLVVFEGTVRSPNAGHEVLGLHYEAWEERVPVQLGRLAHEVAVEHHLAAALVVHRVGDVAVGEPAVVVVAVSPHRDAAFAGARALIDRVKGEAWIWKRERRVDGEVWVEGCGEGDR